jgi:hypothetical protein
VKQDALSPLLFNFALEYAIRSVQEKQQGLVLNGKKQVLVYADHFNVLDGRVYTINKTQKFQYLLLRRSV